MIDSPTFVRDEKGAIYLNATMPSFKGGCLIPTVNPTVVAAAGISAPIALESESDSWSEILSLIGSFTAGATADKKIFLTDIKDYRFGERSLSNKRILVNHVFGTQQKPFLLTTDDKDTNGFGESMLLAPTQFMTFKLVNPGTGSVSFSMLAQRTKIQNKARLSKGVNFQIQETYSKQKQITPYWFTCDQSIAGFNFPVMGVNLTAAIPVGDIFFTNRQNATLILTSLMADFTTTQAGGETTEGFAFELFDVLTGAALQSAPISFNCGAGSGQLPYRLPMPIFVGCRDSIRMRVTNLCTGAGNTKVMPTFYGVAVWNPDGVYQNYGASGDESTI